MNAAARIGVLILLAWAVPAVAQETYTYKTVAGHEIKADVYARPAAAPRPVAVWVHGGALIMGDRKGMDRPLREKLLQAGYAVVSIDYRLAPETKLPEIVEDLKDACRWVRREGPKLFQADSNRLAILGGSAGGYLTLAAGYLVEPRPGALISFWGYGDLAGDWYAKPDPFYSKLPAVPREEAYAAVGSSVLSVPPPKNQRGRFYLYCRQRGLWPKEVAGLDPVKDRAAIEAFCPIKHVTRAYPPTLLVHGTKDTDVPYAQSEQMAAELKRVGVPHEFITIPDGPHGFGGVQPELVADTHARVLAFLQKHLTAGK